MQIQKKSWGYILKVVLLTSTLSGCASKPLFDEEKEGFYDPDFINLLNTDMSAYTSVEQFSEHPQLCHRVTDCRVLYYGDAGCGNSGVLMYTRFLGEENIGYLKRVADNTLLYDAGSSGTEYDVCTGSLPREPLMYCDDICVNAFTKISELSDQIYLLEEELKQCNAD